MGGGVGVDVGKGVPTLDGGRGSYLGCWEGTYLGWGEGYLPWTGGKGYLPWMGRVRGYLS